MTQKFSQSHFRIQTRSQRHSEGPHPRPRRLTKALQPSSQGPMGVCQPHRGWHKLQTVLKLKVGVCTHETLNKVLTEPASPLGVHLDPDMDVNFHALFVEGNRSESQ